MNIHNNHELEEKIDKDDIPYIEKLKNCISQQKIFETFLAPQTSNITPERKIKILCTLLFIQHPLSLYIY